MSSWKMIVGVSLGVAVVGGLVFAGGYMVGFQDGRDRGVAVTEKKFSRAGDKDLGAVRGAASETEKTANKVVRKIDRVKGLTRTAEAYAKKIPGLEGVATGLKSVNQGLTATKSATLKTKDAASAVNRRGAYIQGAVGGGKQGGAPAASGAQAAPGVQPAPGAPAAPAAQAEPGAEAPPVPVAQPLALVPFAATTPGARPPPPPDMPTRLPGQSAEEAAKPSAPPAGGGKPVVFSLQVGYHATEVRARQLRDEMAAKGYPAKVYGYGDAQGRTWYSVSVGDYPDRNAADRAARRFRNAEGRPARVVYLANEPVPPPAPEKDGKEG